VATKYESYIGGVPATWSTLKYNGYISGDLPAQGFTPATTHLLSSVKLYVKKFNDGIYPHQDLGVNIYAVDGSGFPTGASLAHGSISSEGISQDNWEFLEITLDDEVMVSAESTYAICFTTTGYKAGEDEVYWAYTAGNPYAGGIGSHYVWEPPGGIGSAEWSAITGDHYFEEWGTAVPAKAKNPTPTDANSAVTLDQDTIVWEDGGGADTYDVYYGTTSGDLILVSSAQTETSFTVWGMADGSPYDYEVTRYWRIDSTNDVGTTTGDEWSFTTITFDPPVPSPSDPDGDFPPDYAFDPNFIRTKNRLVLAAGHQVWYEVS